MGHGTSKEATPRPHSHLATMTRRASSQDRTVASRDAVLAGGGSGRAMQRLSLIHISEPTRLALI
eukprot:2217123-Alexandrium_andersonii.AAC.1